VQQIKRDHKNKLIHVRNPIRVRGYNKIAKPSLELLKDLYNGLFSGMSNDAFIN